MKLICIGDNVVDCYLDEGVCYPGGDAVNVAVHAKRCGAEKVTYMGVFGNDAEAEHHGGLTRSLMWERGVIGETRSLGEQAR